MRNSDRAYFINHAKSTMAKIVLAHAFYLTTYHFGFAIFVLQFVEKKSFFSSLNCLTHLSVIIHVFVKLVLDMPSKNIQKPRSEGSMTMSLNFLKISGCSWGWRWRHWKAYQSWWWWWRWWWWWWWWLLWWGWWGWWASTI